VLQQARQAKGEREEQKKYAGRKKKKEIPFESYLFYFWAQA